LRSSSILPRTEGTGLRARWIRLFEPLLGLLIIGEAAAGAAAASRFTEYPVPTPGSSPFAIAAGPDRRVWFTELVANKIGAIRPSTASPRT